MHTITHYDYQFYFTDELEKYMFPEGFGFTGGYDYIQKLQSNESDLIAFLCYDDPEDLEHYMSIRKNADNWHTVGEPEKFTESVAKYHIANNK